MMKLRTRALQGLHHMSNEEGEGLCLDGRNASRSERSLGGESYEFGSITEAETEASSPPSSCASSFSSLSRSSSHRQNRQDVSNQSMGRIPGGQATSRECCLGTPNTASTRSISTALDDEFLGQDHGEARTESTVGPPPLPPTRTGLSRGSSARNLGGRGDANSRGVPGRRLVSGVSFRKSFRKEQLMGDTNNEDSEHHPQDAVPADKRSGSGIFGGRRLRRDSKNDCHIGGIKVTKNFGEIKVTKSGPVTKTILQSSGGEIKATKKQSKKDKTKNNSHIGEITITKKASPPTAEAEPSSAEAENRPTALTETLREIMEMDEQDEEENQSMGDGQQLAKHECPQSSRNMKRRVDSLKCHSTHLTGTSRHYRHSLVRSKSTHRSEDDGTNHHEDFSSSSAEISFAEFTEPPEETERDVLECGLEDDRLFVFEGASKVLNINRNSVSDVIANENIILQFSLDKENPVVWVSTEDNKSQTKHLELNVVFAAHVVSQRKPKFRIGGAVRRAPAAA